MRRIVYICPTARFTGPQQRKVCNKYLNGDDSVPVMSDPKDCTFEETVQALRYPGDELVVPNMSIISRTRRELERKVLPVLEKSFVIVEAETGRRVTDVESFHAGLWAAKRQGLTSSQARKAGAKSKGRSISPKKLSDAKKIWRNPAYKNVHEAAKAAGVSVATMYRHFGDRYAIKDPELE